MQVSIVIISKEREDLPEGRAKYAEGVLPRQFKDSSVKKLLILAAFPGVPERYENLKDILDDLGVSAIEHSVSADIKMLLLLIGKPTGKPKYNCPFCDGSAPFTDSYSLYTVGDCYEWHQVSNLDYCVL